MRKRFVAGNWKMNKTVDDAKEYTKLIKKYTEGYTQVIDIILCVPYTLLQTVHDEMKGKNIKVGAQNIYQEEMGAYTGEISADMVKDFAEYVIIGHSERRTYFKEDNADINKKIKLALKKGLKVIFCLGELETERKTGKYKDAIETQFREGLNLVNIDKLDNIIIAYEPVWAIGTGQTATPEQAQEIHKFLRSLVEDIYSKKAAEKIRIIYGGSVNPDNAKDILDMPDIDGCLPGGASLDPMKFSKIIKS